MALLTLSEGLSSGDINRSVPRKKKQAALQRVSRRPERPRSSTLSRFLICTPAHFHLLSERRRLSDWITIVRELKSTN